MEIKAAICGAVALGLAATTALAQESAAIIIGNRNYDTIRDVSEATSAFTLSQELRRQGFQVTTFQDMDAAAMRAAAPRITEILGRASRSVVFVSGQIANSPTGTWLLATDAPPPERLTVGQAGLSLGALMDLMAEDPGRAVLLVGEASAPFSPAAGVASGFGRPSVPQGVTVFAGRTESLASLAGSGLLTAGTSYAAVAKGAARSVRALGFLGAGTGLLASRDAPVPGLSPAELEAFRFEQARSAGTVAALTSFLARYPDGAFSKRAKDLLAELRMTPEERARRAEDALALTRAQRREVQASLNLLGFDTRGVDGVFGPASRAAIRLWQRGARLEESGYLNAEQIAMIDAQARQEQQRVERADAALWQQTGALGTEAGYRAYLERYPAGIFADLARDEIRRIEDARRAGAAAAEDEAWRQAQAANTAKAYRDFLKLYPDGAHATDATQRLDEIEARQEGSALIEAARAEEQQLLGNPITRVLVERRLTQLGFDTGRSEGNFDRTARQAIRNFQRAQGLAETGYVDRQTLAALLNG